MKIFGIGANKTGTTSLARALSILGYRASHWDYAQEMAEHYIKGNFRFPFLENHDAVTDLPIPSIYTELDRVYPGSKFILTVRDVDSWIKSEENHHRFLSDPILEVYLMYGTWRFDREKFINRYYDHNEQAADYFKDRPNDFLILNLCAGEGWEKLCPFLGKPIPAIDFPHEAKRIED